MDTRTTAGPGAAVREWGHIRTFTPWRHLTDPTAERLLARTGWTRPTTPVPPTGDQLADHYLEPLAGGVRLRHRVPRRGSRRRGQGTDDRPGGAAVRAAGP